MKIAVTGSTGFIGTYVTHELEKLSITPTLLVRPSSIDKVSQLKGEVVPFDIADPPEGAFDIIGRPDVLIHLAWEGLPNYMSTRHTEVELATQYRFLSQLVRSGLKSLVVTGTCFEYGMLSGALEESMEVQPDNP